MAKLAPYLTVVAAFLPLAAELYLVTTTAWTLAERIIMRRTLTASHRIVAGADRLEP